MHQKVIERKSTISKKISRTRKENALKIDITENQNQEGNIENPEDNIRKTLNKKKITKKKYQENRKLEKEYEKNKYQEDLEPKRKYENKQI